jgi:hypothetical protein
MYGTIDAFEKKTTFKSLKGTLPDIVLYNSNPSNALRFQPYLLLFLKESRFGVFELWDRSLDADCLSS